MFKVAVGMTLCFIIAGGVLAGDVGPIEAEMAPIVKKAKSPEAQEREQAVSALLGLREAVARRLTGLIEKANKGESDVETKAWAISLIGRMGLVQCKDIVEPEKEWVSKPRNREQWIWANGTGRRDANELYGLPARHALHLLETSTRVHLVPVRRVGDLAKYPLLNEAFKDLESGAWEDRVEAWKSIVQWHVDICREMRAILSPAAPEPQTDKVKITAAFLLGEFRTRNAQMLLRNVDLLDAEKVCATYPATLTVDTPDAAYPCVAALLKIGRACAAGKYLTQIATQSRLSQESRDRIARTAKTMYGNDVTRQYADYITGLEKTIADGKQVGKLKAQVRRLRTVQDILK